IPKSRTKNAKAHVVHLSEQSMAVLARADKRGPYIFSLLGTQPFQEFSRAKCRLDQLSGVTGWRLHDLRRTCVSGMARLGVAPHVADKILNHQAGTISGVADVYQRHDFLAERRARPVGRPCWPSSYGVPRAPNGIKNRCMSHRTDAGPLADHPD